MRYLKSFLILIVMLSAFPMLGQSLDYTLQVKVTAETGESLSGQNFELVQTAYGVRYSSAETVLGADGTCSIMVYGGPHRIKLEKSGYQTYEKEFTVSADCALDIELKEATREPFALNAEVEHDVFTGKNDVQFSWNREAPAFFDDFESYDGFAISFEPWTGIDGDKAAAASLLGVYPNRGSMQYAQIINPLEVDPVWWYEYPVLRPYSGRQYVGFVRTMAGTANDDWLISPAITVGTENVVSFMAKAGDQYREKFMVGITTEENPTADDFKIISAGNYESVSYETWEEMVYDLSAYAGQTVKIGIHYIGEANRGGSFMLMVDDFYVGQPDVSASAGKTAKARRAAMHSPSNPNEKFEVYLNGSKAGETDGYDYLFEDMAAGSHTLGVKAVYKSSASRLVELPLVISGDDYVKLTLNVTTNNGVSPDGLKVSLMDKVSGKTYETAVSGSSVVVPSLPKGVYIVDVKTDMFDEYNAEITVGGEMSANVALVEKLVSPFNVTVDLSETEGRIDASVKWNQDLGFSDSFENYKDFSVNEFGGWKSIDKDGLPVYPIALGSMSNIVTFPGSGTQTAPTAIAPMVFNPYKTMPAMAPTDAAVVPPTGEKAVAFFSSQMALADKWLISPALVVRADYVWRFAAKAYTGAYPESFDICISTSDSEPGAFTVLDSILLTEDYWQTFELDLSKYEGQTVYVALHYYSYDAFFALADDFYVGPGEDSTSAYVGNVQKYEVYLDGGLKGETEEPQFLLEGLSQGSHTVGVKAVYVSGASEISEYMFNAESGVEAVGEEAGAAVVFGGKGEIAVSSAVALPVEIHTPAGRTVAGGMVSGKETFAVAPGIYIVKAGSGVTKVVVK